MNEYHNRHIYIYTTEGIIIIHVQGKEQLNKQDLCILNYFSWADYLTPHSSWQSLYFILIWNMAKVQYSPVINIFFFGWNIDHGSFEFGSYVM